MTSTVAKVRKFPVVEMFGPTIQGEGPSVGERCWFVRLGGCDYRCSWCDSMYAVEPAEVRKADRMDASHIAGLLEARGCTGPVILSGGNPALHELDGLIDEFNDCDWEVHVETQGTMFRPWLNRCDLVVVSPKPPSAGYGAPGLPAFVRFVDKIETPWALKLVVFNEEDMEFAKSVAGLLVLEPKMLAYLRGCFLSAGTYQHGEARDETLRTYKWMVKRMLEIPELARWRAGMQMHVLVWGSEKGH